MNKGILYMAMALLLAGCADDSYRGRENVFAEYETPMEIKVAVGDPYVKGTGPVDSLMNFKNKSIYVWALRRDTLDVDYRITNQQNDLVCLLDGARAKLDGRSAIVEWVYQDKKQNLRDTVYYYPGGEHCSWHYDFYGFYPDDATLISDRREKDALVREYQIDGSQDIMMAKAKLPLDSKTKLPNEFAFSYLSVLKGDDPYFVMKHALTRVDLFVRPGVTSDRHHIRLQTAHLESRTNATVTYVAKDTLRMGAVFQANDAYKFLPLTEADGAELKPYDMYTQLPSDFSSWLDAPEDQRPTMTELQKEVPYKRLGGSFFVSPEKLYRLQMDIRTIDYPEGDRPSLNTNDVKLTDANSNFLQGHRYIIYMTIYGTVDVNIRVKMVPWNFNGVFNLDPDADYEIPIFTDADALLDPDLFLVLKEGDEFALNARNPENAEMNYESTAPGVVSVDAAGILKAQPLPDGQAEATAKVSIRIAVSAKFPEGGYKIIKVKVIKNE